MQGSSAKASAPPPEVKPVSVREFGHHLGPCWAEVRQGNVIRVIHKSAGLHRAYLTADAPEGCEPVRITCTELRASLALVLDRVRDGTVFEVADAQGVQPGNARPPEVRGYLSWAGTAAVEELDRLGAVLRYAAWTGGPGGPRRKLRDIWPLEVAARP